MKPQAISRFLLSIVGTFVAGAVVLSAAGCGPGLMLLGGAGGGTAAALSNKGGDSGGGSSSTNAAPAVVVGGVARTESPALISYTLVDNESQDCGVQVQYEDSGGSFVDCTEGTGGDGTTGLTSSPGGTAHTFSWDFELDMGGTAMVAGFSLRIRAWDGGSWGAWNVLASQTIGNDPPEVVDGSISVTGGSGAILVSFTISDSSVDLASCVVQISDDSGYSWDTLTVAGGDFLGNPPENLLAAAAGSPNQFIWQSDTTLPNFDGDVWIKLIPWDQPTGYSSPVQGTAETGGPFSVNNEQNTQPEIEVETELEGGEFVGEVEIDFTIWDNQSNGSGIGLYWTTDLVTADPSAIAWQTSTVSPTLQASVAGSFSTTPDPQAYSLTWSALADLGVAAPTDVRIVLLPFDSGVSDPFAELNWVLSGVFTVIGNEAPEIDSIEVLHDTGNIPLLVTIVDSASDPVSIDVEYSTDGGTFNPLAASDFVVGDISNLDSSPFGEANVLVWDSTIALGGANYATVYLRITPTDHPPDATPGADLPGFAYTGDPFPIINDPSGADPISLEINETSASDDYTVNLGEVRSFEGIVYPSGAPDDVNWSILEGSPDYGTLAVTGVNTVDYTAPGALPAGSYVTIRGEAATDPMVYEDYILYWGDPVTGVVVAPASADVMAGQTQQFTATVQPGSAPQVVTWRVVGGSTYGTITSGGLYTAPAAVPGSGQATIRATAVDGTSGDALVTIKPQPTGVTVTPAADSPPTWVAPELLLDGSTSFTATVSPAAAPQTVYWRIVWDGVDQGTGNDTVGWINYATGDYTAPHNLPSPVQIKVQAVSSVKPSIYGSYTVTLVAPAPTSFDLSPASVGLTAGGIGQQFVIVNLVPDNANDAVDWSRSPAVGSIDSNGYYTPPADVAAVTNVTITATSIVDGSVTAQALVIVSPGTGETPVSIDISPSSAVAISQGHTVQFTATVNPPGAPQGVTWSMVSGSGGIDAAGLYTPPTTDVDVTETVQAVSIVDGAVLQTADILVTGAGDRWVNEENLSMGRNQPSGIHDPYNGYVWYVGGRSEETGTKHSSVAFYHDLGADTWNAFSSFAGNNDKTSISAVLDAANERLLAFVGNGSASVQVYALDLNPLAAGWTQIGYSYTLSTDVPALSESYRYLTFLDPVGPGSNDDRVVILISSSKVANGYAYTFNTSTEAWGSRTLVTGSAPAEFNKCGHFYDSDAEKHFVIGRSGSIIGGSVDVEVWRIDTGFNLTKLTVSGLRPSHELNNTAAAYYGGGVGLCFGGDNNAGVYYNEFWKVDVSVSGQVSWTQVTLSGEPPPKRADAALVVDTRAWVFGGTNASGGFGDLFEFDLAGLGSDSADSYAATPSGFLPQGRRWAACAWVDLYDEVFCYGGSAEHGPCSDLWAVHFDESTDPDTVTWTRKDPNGTPPPALSGASMVYDAARSRLLLFGGYTPTGTLSDEVYIFDLNTFEWSLMSTSGTPPGARWGAALAIDTVSDRLIVFGGKEDGSIGDLTTALTNDLFYLDLATDTWSQAVPTGSIPDARAFATGGFRASEGAFVAIGGYTVASQGNNQLYSFDLATEVWTSITPDEAGAAGIVFNSAAVYDDASSRFLNAPHGDDDLQAVVFATPGTTWQYLLQSNWTNARGASGAYDPDDRRFFAVFGEVYRSGEYKGTNRVSFIAFE